MGSAGGIIIYILDGKELICYETSVYEDATTYNMVYEFITEKKGIFKYHYGGFGNHVYISGIGLNSK